MKILLNFLKFAASSFLTAFILILIGYLAILLRVPISLPNLTVNNIVTTPTAQSSPASTGSTPVPLEYRDALNTYQAVATTAIQSSKEAVELMKWFIILVMALSSTATAVTAYLYKSTREIDERVKQATLASTEAKNAVDEASKQLKVLSDKYKKLYDRLNESFDADSLADDAKAKTPSISDIIEAENIDEKALDLTSHLEAQQRLSFSKYIIGNTTGWSELNAQLKYEHGLLPGTVKIIRAEISKIDKMKNPDGRKLAIRKKLQQLLEKNNKSDLS